MVGFVLPATRTVALSGSSVFLQSTPPKQDPIGGPAGAVSQAAG